MTDENDTHDGEVLIQGCSDTTAEAITDVLVEAGVKRDVIRRVE